MALPPFQTLLDAHAGAVHRFLVATVGRLDADDCYQETWLAALGAYPRLHDDRNLRGWLMTIAHRKAMDHLRAGRRRPVPGGEASELPGRGGAQSAATTGAATAAGAAATGATVAVATEPGADGVWGQVAQLPPKQRAAVALRYILDAGYPEIAAAMDISEDAARRNVHEGLKRLRRELVP